MLQSLLLPNESAGDGVLCSPIYERAAVPQPNGSLDPLRSMARGFLPQLFGPLPGFKEMAVVTERRKSMYYGRGYGGSGGSGRGGSYGGGMGFGFRGSSPGWPYVGRGRGGLPRCYAYSGYGNPAMVYGPGVFPAGQDPRPWGTAPYGVPNSPQQELQFLKDRAEMIRQELGAIDARIQKLEVEKAERGKQS
jgi:hypothetical protein